MNEDAFLDLLCRGLEGLLRGEASVEQHITDFRHMVGPSLLTFVAQQRVKVRREEREKLAGTATIPLES